MAVRALVVVGLLLLGCGGPPEAGVAFGTVDAAADAAGSDVAWVHAGDASSFGADTPAPQDSGSGACCLPGGSACEHTSPAACDAAGGAWLTGASCPTARCDPAARGACCLPDGSCDPLSADVFGHGDQVSECRSLGGAWLGGGTSCATTLCPTGDEIVLCCLPEGVCETSWRQKCALRGGAGAANAAGCEVLGCGPPEESACCLSAGACVETTTPECLAQGGVRTAGRCSEAPCGAGACCEPSGACTAAADGAECAAHGGLFAGAGASCAACESTGACCEGSVCRVAAPITCSGPVVAGATCGFTQCEPIGACCRKGACTPLTAGECADGGGDFHKGSCPGPCK